jgi:hypothetical protein
MEDEVNLFYTASNPLLNPINMHVVSMLKKYNGDLNVDAWWDRIRQVDKNGDTNPYVPYDYCSSLRLEKRNALARGFGGTL